jgi:hypothetical protein
MVMLLELIALLLSMKNNLWSELPLPLIKPALLAWEIGNFMGYHFNLA